mmetsp:Transcript_36933/g.73504  ORF Transcript_36933/g.73504 Transcript_36933/m.73504 type:complete len:204 (-) Transcript_36933:100-711(-)
MAPLLAKASWATTTPRCHGGRRRRRSAHCRLQISCHGEASTRECVMTTDLRARRAQTSWLRAGALLSHAGANREAKSSPTRGKPRKNQFAGGNPSGAFSPTTRARRVPKGHRTSEPSFEQPRSAGRFVCRRSASSPRTPATSSCHAPSRLSRCSQSCSLRTRACRKGCRRQTRHSSGIPPGANTRGPFRWAFPRSARSFSPKA